MKRQLSLVAVATVSAAMAFVVPVPAAAVPVVSDPIASGFEGPLQMDLGAKGQLYVAQDFAGVITKVRANGTTKDVVTEPGEVAGVASNGYDVTYTFIGGTEDEPIALLKRRLANGTIKTIADLGLYEAEHNPDAFARYGFRHLAPDCAAQVPPAIGGEPYGGIAESHPYAVANDPDGGWYVADAGANAILHVSPSGDIEVVKVPRPVKAGITAEAAEALGLPDCTIGEVFAYEPVPTDVEVNARGYLIVSLLPGGSEDGRLGARGQIMRISPGDFEWTIMTDGIAGAANIATAPGGRVYVSELFGNQISVLRNHVLTPVTALASPAALEFENGKLYASTDVFGAGSIVSITP
jgi:hypothetical protein